MSLEYGIFSTRRFNMAGIEIDQDSKPIPNGQIFFGGDYILNPGGGMYQLVIQHVRNGENPKTFEIIAKSERAARTKINKMFPHYRVAYNQPQFRTFEDLQKARDKQKEI